MPRHNSLDILKREGIYLKSNIARARLKTLAVIHSNTADKKNKRNNPKSSTTRCGEKDDDDNNDSFKRQQDQKSFIFFILALIASRLSSYSNKRFSQFSFRHLQSSRQYLLIHTLRI